MPTTLAPATRASWPATAPTPPVAEPITTGAPKRGCRCRTCATYAVSPGMPSAPRAAESGTPGGTDTGVTDEPGTTADDRQPVSARTCCPVSTSGQHDSTTSPTDRPGGTSPTPPSEYRW